MGALAAATATAATAVSPPQLRNEPIVSPKQRKVASSVFVLSVVRYWLVWRTHSPRTNTEKAFEKRILGCSRGQGEGVRENLVESSHWRTFCFWEGQQRVVVRHPVI